MIVSVRVYVRLWVNMSQCASVYVSLRAFLCVLVFVCLLLCTSVLVCLLLWICFCVRTIMRVVSRVCLCL